MHAINRKYLVPHEEALARSLKRDPEFQALWEAGTARRQAVATLIGERIKHQLTQQQLADKAGLKQPSLARAESGSVSMTIDFLGKVAHALGKDLDIRFVEPRHNRHYHS